MPTGLRYGVALHRHGYGSFVEELVKEALRLSLGPGSDLSAFILGFTTHAPLDRARPSRSSGTLPGWVDPKEEASRRLYHAHPFLERILDVLVLRERFGMKPLGVRLPFEDPLRADAAVHGDQGNGERAQRRVPRVQLQEPQQAEDRERLPRRHVLLQAHQPSQPGPREARLPQGSQGGLPREAARAPPPAGGPRGLRLPQPWRTRRGAIPATTRR